MNATEPTIRTARNHYGYPTVWVESYRTTDIYGDEVEVDSFLLNGPAWPEASGSKIRKDGERAHRQVTLNVVIPENVRAALDAIQAEMESGGQ